MNALKIITSTNRPSSQGIKVAEWIKALSRETNSFDVELLDLGKINLPFMNESEHPRLQKYEHEHTKRWSKAIDEADAFIIVLGEYNSGFPAPMKNALDYLFHEWKHKPVGIVSYGGQSAGLRAATILKPVLSTLSMTPTVAGVAIPFFMKQMNDQEQFKPDEHIEKAAHAMLEELQAWSTALKQMRN